MAHTLGELDVLVRQLQGLVMLTGCSLRSTDANNPVAGPYAWTAVGLADERLDTNDSHPVGGNNARWQVPLTGWYWVAVHGVWDTNVGGTRGVKIYNVTQAKEVIALEQPASPTAGEYTQQSGGGLRRLAAGDVLEFQALQLGSGGIVGHRVYGDHASGMDLRFVGV